MPLLFFDTGQSWVSMNFVSVKLYEPAERPFYINTDGKLQPSLEASLLPGSLGALPKGLSYPTTCRPRSAARREYIRQLEERLGGNAYTTRGLCRR